MSDLNRKLLAGDLERIIAHVDTLRVADYLQAEALQAGLPPVAMIDAAELDRLHAELLTFQRRLTELYA